MAVLERVHCITAYAVIVGINRNVELFLVDSLCTNPLDSQRKKDVRTFTVIKSDAEDNISTSFSMQSQKERRALQELSKSQRSRIDLLRSGAQSTSQCVTGTEVTESDLSMSLCLSYIQTDPDGAKSLENLRKKLGFSRNETNNSRVQQNQGDKSHVTCIHIVINHVFSLAAFPRHASIFALITRHA